jgi:tyrosine-protein phosphatase YwqE
MGWLSNLLGGNVPDVDLGVLKTDVHSHLIPGIDDGSVSIEDSLNLVRGLHALGYSKLITTPHIMSDFYRNTPEIILSGLEKVREAVAKEGIPVELEAAAEYYCDHDFERSIDAKNLLTFGGNHVLVELSYLNPSDNFETVTFKLQMEGYKVVLAHPERYPYWYQSFNKYEELRDKGVLLQINLASITGHYGSVAKRLSERLIENNMVDFLGTDTHKMSHVDVFRKSRKEPFLRRLIESGRLKNDQL